jgi:hypothetical protein
MKLGRIGRGRQRFTRIAALFRAKNILDLPTFGRNSIQKYRKIEAFFIGLRRFS